MPLEITSEIKNKIQLTAKRLVEQLKTRTSVDAEFAFEAESLRVSVDSAEGDESSAILEYFIEKITKEIQANEKCVDDLDDLPGKVDVDSQLQFRRVAPIASWTRVYCAVDWKSEYNSLAGASVTPACRSRLSW